MRIGFTGTRAGMTNSQKEYIATLLKGINPLALHHGDCIGADEEVHAIAQSLGIAIVVHPPLDTHQQAFVRGPVIETKEPKEYLQRNQDIVDDTDYLLACPKENFMVTRSGTWYTVRYAKKVGRVTTLILPSGIIKEWAPGMQT